MKPMLVILIAAAVLVAAASAASHLSATPRSASAGAKYVEPPRLGVLVQYGHIKALTRKGRRFELRFDPAWWLGGETARRAAVEDKAIRPGESVPNDYYIVEESHRPLTYLVPPTARVTIVTMLPRSERSTVSELAQLVKGKNPKHRRWLNMHLGFWIRVKGDTVRSLDQQYQP